jgi:hypothetical protein
MLSPVAANAQWQNSRAPQPQYRGNSNQQSYSREYRGYDRGYRNDGGWYRDDYRNRRIGRSVAIIGGGAAAGAAVGAVTGGGKGAAVGALIGGVSGLVIDQATKHRHRNGY